MWRLWSRSVIAISCWWRHDDRSLCSMIEASPTFWTHQPTAQGSRAMFFTLSLWCRCIFSACDRQMSGWWTWIAVTLISRTNRRNFHLSRCCDKIWNRSCVVMATWLSAACRTSATAAAYVTASSALATVTPLPQPPSKLDLLLVLYTPFIRLMSDYCTNWWMTLICDLNFNCLNLSEGLFTWNSPSVSCTYTKQIVVSLKWCEMCLVQMKWRVAYRIEWVSLDNLENHFSCYAVVHQVSPPSVVDCSECVIALIE